jgi:ubiquinone/menaquinone biosynthesis C-methylase UbiE
MDHLRGSWNSISKGTAEAFLKTQGHPSLESKMLLLNLLKEQAAERSVSILDLGCGNAHLYEFFKNNGLSFQYTGVDYSESLISAALKCYGSDHGFCAIQDDISELSSVKGRFDIAIYSHVIEMMSCPEKSLCRVSRLANSIYIRFFEPPEFDFDAVELQWMDVGDDRTAPYLRRKMSKDYYRLILSKIHCKRVDLFRSKKDRDQVHRLVF